VVFFKFLFCPCINNQDVVFHIVCPYQKGNPGHAPAKVLGSPFVDRHVVSEISGDKRLFLQDLFYKFGFCLILKSPIPHAFIPQSAAGVATEVFTTKRAGTVGRIYQGPIRQVAELFAYRMVHHFC